MSYWTKTFIRVNAFVYQKTNGRLGSRLGKQSVLLLHTTGRKSGKSFTTPLSFYRDGNSYLLVASNWGKENNPNWFKNLLEHPSTTIQVGAATIPVETRPAQGDEYNRLWEIVTAKNEQYLKYQKSLARQIPIMILTPKSTS
jgi:deazaflavin-dependent oxidoreductase (nitroreductase family)